MRKSKCLIVLLSLLLVCSLIFAITACDKNKDDNNGGQDNLPLHTHNWDNEFKSDDSGHWHICTICGVKSDIEKHDFEVKYNSVTNETHTVICADCDYRIENENHVFEQKSDSAGHWTECTRCDFRKDESAHSFVDKYDNKFYWQECSYCGFSTGKIVCTKELAFELSSDGKSYILTGIGDTTETNIQIPGIHNDKPVTSIANSAFKYCRNILSVQIPNTVIEIGEQAFFACSKLERVIISDSVQRIGDSAFAFCGSLDKISFGKGVKSIGNRVFENCSFIQRLALGENVETIGNSVFVDCTSLQTVTFGAKVAKVGETLFKNCDSLESIIVSEDNAIFKSESNCLLSKDGKVLYAGCKTSIIPEGVTRIENTAFSGCKGITSIKLPSTLVAIGQFAFSICEALTEIFIPSSLTHIEQDAFNGCTMLNTINFGGTKTEWLDIVKDSAWDNDTREFIIICTDGKLTKGGEEIE